MALRQASKKLYFFFSIYISQPSTFETGQKLCLGDFKERLGLTLRKAVCVVLH